VVIPIPKYFFFSILWLIKTDISAKDIIICIEEADECLNLVFLKSES